MIRRNESWSVAAKVQTVEFKQFATKEELSKSGRNNMGMNSEKIKDGDSPSIILTYCS